MENEDSNEMQFQQAAALVDFHQAQLEGLAGQVELISSNIVQFRSTEQTLAGLSKMEKDPEVLIPIGGDTIIRAQTTGGPVLIGLGSGVVVEQELELAVETLNGRISELELSRTRLLETMAKIREIVQHEGIKMQSLYDAGMIGT